MKVLGRWDCAPGFGIASGARDSITLQALLEETLGVGG